MPAYAAKIRGKWRVVHGHPPRISLNSSGTPVDGGGHPTKEKAQSQARAIDARKSGYPPRVRHNPKEGAVERVWVCPNGEVLTIKDGVDWSQEVPEEIAHLARHENRQQIHRAANRLLFFRGAIINGRLYVYSDTPGEQPTRRTTAKLDEYCDRENLSRGLIVESS